MSSYGSSHSGHLHPNTPHPPYPTTPNPPSQGTQPPFYPPPPTSAPGQHQQSNQYGSSPQQASPAYAYSSSPGSTYSAPSMHRDPSTGHRRSSSFSFSQTPHTPMATQVAMPMPVPTEMSGAQPIAIPGRGYEQRQQHQQQQQQQQHGPFSPYPPQQQIQSTRHLSYPFSIPQSHLSASYPPQPTPNHHSSISHTNEQYGYIDPATEAAYEARYQAEKREKRERREAEKWERREDERRPTLGDSVISVVGRVGKIFGAERH